MPPTRKKRKREEKTSEGEEESEKYKKISVERKQLYWIMGMMVGVVVLFFLVYWIIQSTHNFTYEGLTFTKELYGKIPVFHYYYYFKGPDGGQYRYNLFLRNDPRKNMVPLTGNIVYDGNVPVYISINTTELNLCPQSTIAVADLTSFLTNNFIEVRSGTPDENMARELNRTYVTCKNQPTSGVIIIQAGSITSIVSKDNCYTITLANCEIMQAIEKFKVQSILDAKRNAQR